jgi:hypothetical protein
VSSDTLRTGWDQNEPGLAPSQVTAAGFGQLWSAAVNGQVYAQPVVAGSTVIVATENNYVYGLDVATGSVKWSADFGAAWPASTNGCGDLTPTIGVTATPVYDPGTGTVYLTAKVNDGADAQHPHWYLHALNAQTGAELSGWPVTIQGTPSNDPGYPFNPAVEMQRPGLLLMDGSVYAAFGGHCDLGNYAGFVVGVNTTTQALSMWVDEPGPGSKGAGIWQSGGGLVSDGSGRIFLATGNGVSPGVGPGTAPPAQLAESVVRLAVAADGTMSAQDFFSPSNAPTLDTNDQDFGSGGPVALPGSFGTAEYPHLMVEEGKDGRVFLLNRDSLGGRGQGSGGTDNVLGMTGPIEGVWGHPAVWGGDGGYIYLDGSGGPLRALQYGVTGAGLPALSLAGNSTANFGYTSGSPVVTSTGTTSGSAVVWVVQTTGASGGSGQLLAYSAVPVSGTLQLLRSFPLGTVSKFAVPATDSGRVFVGTRDGHVIAFGQPTPAPLTSPPFDFGPVGVGTTGNGTVTLTAATDVTVSAISAKAPFAAQPGTLPVYLTAGQTLSVPVTFTPSAPGTVIGTLTVTTDSGVVTMNMSGTGTQSGFSASLSALSFGTVPAGLTKTLSVSITNTGVAPEPVSAVTSPTGAFTATGMPAVGTSINAGVSVVIPITYTPTAAQTDTSSLTVTGPDGTATVSLTGTAVAGTDQLTISPAILSFGQLTVGQKKSLTFTISNTGNLPLNITKAAPPAAPFIVASPISEGLAMSPGVSVTTTVTFTPTAAGTFSGSYQITADTGQGAQQVTVTGTAVSPPPQTRKLPAPGGIGWKYNHGAVMSGTDLVLTSASPGRVATALNTSVLPTAHLTATFTAKMGGGTGGEGECLLILDATKAKPTAVGIGGAGLGFLGLPGTAVCLAARGNFIGITRGGGSGRLVYLATSTAIGALRKGTHVVAVSVAANSYLVVSVDGKKVFDKAVALPTRALLGFSASTDGWTDTHIVRGVTVTYR